MTSTEMKIFLIILIIMTAIVSLFLPFYIHCKKEEKKEQLKQEEKGKINAMTKEEATNYLLVHLNNYHIETFINIFFQLMENDHAMSQDEIVSIKDTILDFLYNNITHFGTEIKSFDYDNIITAFIKLEDYNPYDNMINFDSVNLITRAEYKNTRYYQKRKIKDDSFSRCIPILRKRKNEILELLGISVENLIEFYNLFRKAVYKMYLDLKCKFVLKREWFSGLDAAKIKKIIDILSKTQNVRIYLYDTFMVATDYFFFIDNYYELIEEELSEKGSIINSIRQERGRELEKDLFKYVRLTGIQCERNYMLDDLEIDLLARANQTLIIFEAKSLLYNSNHFENKDSRKGLIKSIGNATKQLYKRIETLKNRKKIYFCNSELLIDDYEILPILVVSNDLYEIINTTNSEATELGYQLNPLILDYDTLAYILDSRKEINFIIEYLKFRLIQKQYIRLIDDEAATFCEYNNRYGFNSFQFRKIFSFGKLIKVCESSKNNPKVLDFISKTKKSLDGENLDCFKYCEWQIAYASSIEEVFNRKYHLLDDYLYLHRDFSDDNGAAGWHLYFDSNLHYKFSFVTHENNLDRLVQYYKKNKN